MDLDSGVEEDGAGVEPPHNSVNFLEIRAYKNHYSIVKGYFRFQKLSINCYFTRHRVVKLRCLLSNIISKFLVQIYARIGPPSYH